MSATNGASTTTNVLITGANRGIGRGLTELYLARPNHIVIAAVRDPSNSTVKSLAELPTGNGTKLITVKIDGLSETDAGEAASKLKNEFKVSHLDLVIANAGIAKHFGPAAETPIKEVRDHFDVNTVGSLILFQGLRPLLNAAPSNPRFSVVSTTLSSIGDMDKWPLAATAYGASKAAVNYIVKKIHLENEWLTAFLVHPGWVQTDMGNNAATVHGVEHAPETVDGSVAGLIKIFDSATREKTSGTLKSYDGEVIGW